MKLQAALDAIVQNYALFTADQLARLDSGKAKLLRLAAKIGYFQGSSAYYRIAVVCPLEEKVTEQQLLEAGLIWANKVSNGEKTVLYLVGKRFTPVINYLIHFFGPRIEVRLAYFTPKLRTTFMVAGKDVKSLAPRYSLPVPRTQDYWEKVFNPVEKGWFLAALEYFKGFCRQGIEVCFLDNWVSVKFQGLEIVRLSKKESRLKISLTTRYPREVSGLPKEEKEGWINAQGLLNSEFTAAFEARLSALREDRGLFSRLCPEKQFLEHLLCAQLIANESISNAYCQLDVGVKGETSLTIDILGKNSWGNLLVIAVSPNRDISGFVRCLEQLVWAKVYQSEIKRIYFADAYLSDPEGWVVSCQKRAHPDLEMLWSLLVPTVNVKLAMVNEDWLWEGIKDIKWLTNVSR
ncbi:MAG TPA: hypothetical protein VNU93_01410 [Verrucomicrobiae bacterium]|nr:hypothetical protein [Verrucomicrobiae bacterium]